MHLACAHHVRRKGRDAALWNKACDLVVNQLLLDAGFSLPQGATHDPTYTGLSAEALYSELARLQDEPPNKGAERPEVQEETEQAEGGTGQSGEGKGESKDQKSPRKGSAARPNYWGDTELPNTVKRKATGNKQSPWPLQEKCGDHPVLDGGSGTAQKQAEQEPTLNSFRLCSVPSIWEICRRAFSVCSENG